MLRNYIKWTKKVFLNQSEIIVQILQKIKYYLPANLPLLKGGAFALK
jgi:hypothetical protein